MDQLVTGHSGDNEKTRKKRIQDCQVSEKGIGKVDKEKDNGLNGK